MSGMFDFEVLAHYRFSRRLHLPEIGLVMAVCLPVLTSLVICCEDRQDNWQATCGEFVLLGPGLAVAAMFFSLAVVESIFLGCMEGLQSMNVSVVQSNEERELMRRRFETARRVASSRAIRWGCSVAGYACLVGAFVVYYVLSAAGATDIVVLSTVFGILIAGVPLVLVRSVLSYGRAIIARIESLERREQA